jgi:agmatinase
MRLPHTIASQQTYTAANTFLRVPGAEEATGCDVAILGIPFDLATTNRPGARYGAAAIRTASALLADLKSYPGGYDPL